jgi:hypothetical protein
MNEIIVANLAEDASGSVKAETANISPPKEKISRKKILLSLFAIVAIAAITATLMIPPGAATLPLEVNYIVGEKMVYDETMTGTFEYGNSVLPTENPILPNGFNYGMTQTIEVTAFDGEFYTLNLATTTNSEGKQYNSSLILKMDKTGYSAYLFDLGGTQLEIPDSSVGTTPSLTQLFNKSEVKVGDSVKVPLPQIGNSTTSMTGDFTITFKGVQNLTVPAGTYKVFRIDLTSDNIQMDYTSQLGDLGNFAPANITTNTNIDYQVYIEYGTMRQIKSSSHATVSSTLGYSMATNMEMELIQHIKPS